MLGRVAIFGLLGVVALLRLTPPWEVNHDCGWMLYVAHRVLQGDALYSDIIELNPPLVVYLSVLPASLARWLAIGVGPAFHAFIVILVVLVLPWTRRIVRDAPPLAFALLGFVLLVPVGMDFGQREHLVAILTLPYFAVVLRRGDRLRRRSAFFAGLLAAVGFALKPHFLLAPFLMRVGVACFDRKPFAGRRPENEGLLTGLLLYGLHFCFVPFRAEFFAHVELVREVYPAFDVSIVEFFRRPWGWQAVVFTAGFGVVAWVAPRGREALRLLWLAQIGFLAAALLQAKGFSYHVLPVFLIGYAGVVAWIFTTRWRWLHAAGLLACLGYGALHLGQHWLQRHADTGAIEWADEFTGIPAGFEAVQELRPSAALVVLDTDIHTFFGWMLDHDIAWASRYACLWPLPGGSPAHRTALLGSVVADLRRVQPQLVFVRRGRPSFMRQEDFDMLAWLRSAPEFEAELEAYTELEGSAGFHVFRRR